VRVPELDASAHAVGARTAAKDVRQPLTQPPLRPSGGDEDQLGGERVDQGLREEGTETVGQQIGSLGAVQMQGHRPPP
jgi:hypothetical protein